MEAIKHQWHDFVRGVKKLASLHFVAQVCSLLMVLSGALIFYKFMMLVSNSESPIVVVLSGSMEPGIHRGDVIVLSNSPEPYRVGEVVVYRIPGRDIPIVHRIHRVLDFAGDRSAMRTAQAWSKSESLPEQLLMTKGDNNFMDDVSLYEGRKFISREYIVGRAIFMIPYGGWLTIVLNDYPALKVVLIGGLSLVALFVSD